MSASEIIRVHREHLIRRVVSRNPLLLFAPTDRSVARTDVSSFFGGTRHLPAESENPRNLCNDGVSFVKEVIGGHGAAIQLPEKTPMLGRLRRLAERARLENRTTGQWPLVLAWPFLHIPKDVLLNSPQKPRFAPLFLWKIGMRFQGTQVHFSLKGDEEKDAVSFNSILGEYLRLNSQEGVNLMAGEDWTNEMCGKEFSERCKVIKEWLRQCSLETSGLCEDSIVPYTLQEDKAITIVSSAIVGLSNFRYHSLLSELETLESQAKANPDKIGLLAHFLNGGNEGSSPIPPKQPAEQGCYLVEKSDPSQEYAVWACREENAPILQLRGPPGTGKSQTIVNLVADALQESKKVAVVCHHTAALEVVQKRLAAVGLGELVTKVTSPKENRHPFIKRAREAGDEDCDAGHFSSSHREQLCRDIAEHEEIVAAHLDSFHRPGWETPSGKRGHLRAKIDAVRASIGFDASFPSPFRDGLGKILAPLPDKEDEFLATERKLLRLVGEVAQKWQDCDYARNPWAGIASDNHIQEELTAIFRKLLLKINNAVAIMGEKPLPRYWLHPLSRNHFSKMAAGDRREMAENYSEIVRLTRMAFKCASMPSKGEKILVEFGISAQMAADEYKQLNKKISSIPAVHFIDEKIKDEPVVAYLQQHHADHPSDGWVQILKAVFCQLLISGFSSHQPNYSDARQGLAQSIGAKKEEDAKVIFNQYARNRKESCRRLHSMSLLQLKRSARNPATTLRDIYHEVDRLIWDAFPVLLASPDSVSQILPLSPDSLDLVIVDEASQIYMADVMPLLYRAKKIVVSGDEWQMPPSALFTMKDNYDVSEEGDEGEEVENEIRPDVPYEFLDALKKCIQLDSEKVRRLRVHYRSHSRELIDFSNHAFYKGELQAAPMNGNFPKFLHNRPILLEHCAGRFAGSRNEIEAAKIAEKLEEIWENTPELSTGVIVFNIEQADYVRACIDEKAEKDEAFRKLYQRATALEEDGEYVGFFVRSVEHVQGDERDIVILATTYGTERRSYGPIGQQDLGRRRLNVAVTRAKRGMIVLTSLDIDTIANEGDRPDDLGEGGFERWYLWKYLQYARAVCSNKREEAANILRSLDQNPRSTAAGQHLEANEFELQVGKFLEDNGLHVEYQVGADGFRIDIGVKEKVADGRYLCGVECDGRRWHSTWRARHNDVWRQGILEDKGWRIVRIWSDEWFSNDPQARARFLEKIKRQR